MTDDSSPRRFDAERAFLIPSIAVFILYLIRQTLSAPFWDRNASRLVGAVCFHLGFPLYPAHGAGPVQSMNYPPLSALMFWPAALAATPTRVILIGTALNILYFFVPAWLICGWAVGDGLSLRTKTALAACFTALALYSEPLAYCALHVHADAPALGFGGLSCLFLVAQFGFPRRWAYALSAFFLICALGAKQTLAPMILLLPAWIVLAYGWEEAARYAAWIAGLGATALLWLFAEVSPSVLSLHLFYISQKPWADPWPGILGQVSAELLRDAFPFALLLFAGTLFQRETLKRPVSLFLIVALGMAPVAVASRAKLGVDINALSVSLYFLALAALYALARLHAVRGGILALFTLIFGLPLLSANYAALWRLLPQNPQETAYDYLRAHPGEIYFPWNPLSHLMAEHRLYHFEPALIDWAMSGHPISQTDYEAFIPKTMTAIAYHRTNDFTHEATAHYLPGYTDEISLPELPGWRVYKKHA